MPCTIDVDMHVDTGNYENGPRRGRIVAPKSEDRP